MTDEREALPEPVAFDAHIRSTAWHAVLSQESKHNTEDAAVFRLARMAAEVAWEAAYERGRFAGLEEAQSACALQAERWQSVDSIKVYAAHECQFAIRALAAPGAGKEGGA